MIQTRVYDLVLAAKMTITPLQ
uniref:Uncharacterized protein n=1 Tax=Arundo donax TaxID=35708 RepID=A0A0A8YYW1_ARUDO